MCICQFFCTEKNTSTRNRPLPSTASRVPTIRHPPSPARAHQRRVGLARASPSVPRSRRHPTQPATRPAARACFPCSGATGGTSFPEPHPSTASSPREATLPPTEGNVTRCVEGQQATTARASRCRWVDAARAWGPSLLHGRRAAPQPVVHSRGQWTLPYGKVARGGQVCAAPFPCPPKSLERPTPSHTVWGTLPYGKVHLSRERTA
jgi:hypothetical protein